MVPLLPFTAQSSTSLELCSRNEGPSSRVVPMSSPEDSGSGAMWDACSPGHKLGYDHFAVPFSAPALDWEANGFGPVVSTVQPSRVVNTWPPPVDVGL